MVDEETAEKPVAGSQEPVVGEPVAGGQELVAIPAADAGSSGVPKAVAPPAGEPTITEPEVVVLPPPSLKATEGQSEETPVPSSLGGATGQAVDRGRNRNHRKFK